MNTPDTYLGLISLHRSAKIRVKQYGGDFVNLHPTQVTWVDTTDDYNLKQLNHHASVGQFLVIGQWSDLACGPTPPETDLSTDPWWFPVRTLNDTAKIRVKGWQYNPETDTNSYGYHNLRPDITTYLYIGFVPYDEDGVYERGQEDEDDWQYNLRQLGHHNAIGQYVATGGSSWTFIQGLNDTSNVRVYDNDYDAIRTAKSKVEAIGTSQITSLTSNVTGGSLLADTTYYYVVTANGLRGTTQFEGQYSASQSIYTSEGFEPSSEIQVFKIANEGSGTYSLSYNDGSGHTFETDPLDYDANNGTIQSALNAGFQSAYENSEDYVTVTQWTAPDNDMFISFKDGFLDNQDVATLTVNDIDLNEGATVSVEEFTKGGQAPQIKQTITFNGITGQNNAWNLGYNTVVYKSQTKNIDVEGLNWNVSAANLQTEINAAFNTAFETTGVTFATVTRSGVNGTCMYTITFTSDIVSIHNNDGAGIDVWGDSFTGDPASVYNIPVMDSFPIISNTDTVTITWTPVNGAISYNVYRSIDGDFDNITSDEYRVALNVTTTSFVDDGSSTDSAIPSPAWWSGIIGTDLNLDRSRNILNHHTSIGQYIVWPYNLTDDIYNP